MSWKVLIVDDEAPARMNLVYALADHPQWSLAGNCRSAAEARQQLAQQKVDLVFLDIRMPQESGLDFAAWLCEQDDPPLIIFITAYDEHALAAFDVYAIDYVLKPFDDTRFAKALERADEQLRLRRNADETEDMRHFLRERQAAAAGKAAPALQYIVVRSVGYTERVAVDAILWLRSAGNYVELHLSDRFVLHRSPLGQLEQRLSASDFMRVHRTALVRRSAITGVAVEGDGMYTLTLSNGELVPVSERHIEAVRAEINR